MSSEIKAGALVRRDVNDCYGAAGEWRVVGDVTYESVYDLGLCWPESLDVCEDAGGFTLLAPAAASIAEALANLAELNSSDCKYDFPFVELESGVMYWQAHLEGPRYEPAHTNNGPIRLDTYDAHMRDMQKFAAVAAYIAAADSAQDAKQGKQS